MFDKGIFQCCQRCFQTFGKSVGNVEMKTKWLLVSGRTVVEWWSNFPIFRNRPPGVSACKRALYCRMVAEWSKILNTRVRAHVCAYIIFRDKLNKKACEAKTKKFNFFKLLWWQTVQWCVIILKYYIVCTT